MKKIFALILGLALMAGVTGCQNTGKSFFGTIKGVVIGDDYEAAGERVGYAGYMAYVVMKGDPKYDKYTSKMEEIYKILDESGTFDTASINQTILEVAQVALTAKYGFVYGSLITEGVRVGGAVADRMFLKNVSASNATLYAQGIKVGVDKARAETPQEFLDEAAAKAAEKAEKEANKKEAKYITCTEGQCEYDFTKMRKTANQLKLANELKKDGWLDYTEQKTEEVLVTKAENVEHFIERTTNLKKLKIKTLKVWIGKMKVDAATHKLVSIQFLREDLDGNVMETTCVACEGDLELIEREDNE